MADLLWQGLKPHDSCATTHTFTCLRSGIQPGAMWGGCPLLFMVWGLGRRGCYWRVAGRDSDAVKHGFCGMTLECTGQSYNKELPSSQSQQRPDRETHTLVCFEIGSLRVVQTILKLAILLPRPPECSFHNV